MFQISTDHYMPQRRARGFTADRPSKHLPPRLFRTRRGAQQALSWWLRGIAYNKNGLNNYGDIEIIITQDNIPRDKDDMRVVELCLTMK